MPLPDEELRDDCLVVRFNLMDLGLLRAACDKCLRALGYHGLSFAGENGWSEEEIASQVYRSLHVASKF